MRRIVYIDDRIEPDELPRDYRLNKRYKSLASLLDLTNGLRAVDVGMKALIEELEPGVHQFWHMQFTQPNGEEYPVAYFGMKVGRFLDSFLPEQSDAKVFVDRGNQRYIGVAGTKKEHAGLVMSASAIGSAHLWEERRLKRPQLYISDAMQHGIAVRGLRTMKHFKLTVV